MREPNEQGGLERPRVLVVDDEGPIVQIAVEVLRGSGYEPLGLISSEEALDLPIEDYDAVVTDFKMPRLDGVSMFRRLRLRNPQLVGVLMTGFGNLQLVQMAMQIGFSGILLKPFPLERLTGALERALRQRRLTAENHQLEAILDVYTAAQDLTRPRDRHELAGLLPRLVRQSISADRVMVMLVDPKEGRLLPPSGAAAAGPWPDWVRQLIGATCAEAIEASSLSAYGPQRICLPLRCDDQTEGVLLLERAAGPLENIELEQLSLLLNQAALALSHMRLFDQELREAKMALVGQMAGVICDRLRQPVQIIKQTAESLAVAEPDYVQMIIDETERLQTMATELSDFVTGSEALTLTRCQLGDLIRDLARRMQPQFEEAGLTAEVHIIDEVETAIDQGKIGRALHNLVKNAVEAMQPGGTLTLALQRDGHLAEIMVRDTGCGMSREVQQHVFDPFFTHGKPGGTGLGGAVVRSSVRAHGGRCECESDLGLGTTFRVYLPISGLPVRDQDSRGRED